MSASVHVFRCGGVQEEAMRGHLLCLERNRLMVQHWLAFDKYFFEWFYQ